MLNCYVLDTGISSLSAKQIISSSQVTWKTMLPLTCVHQSFPEFEQTRLPHLYAIRSYQTSIHPSLSFLCTSPWHTYSTIAKLWGRGSISTCLKSISSLRCTWGLPRPGTS